MTEPAPAPTPYQNLRISPAKFLAASGELAKVKADMESTLTELVQTLNDCAGKAGNDTLGHNFSVEYSAQVTDPSGGGFHAATVLANAVGSCEYRLAITGNNHAHTEFVNSHLHPNQCDIYVHPPEPSYVPLVVPASIEGEGSDHHGLWDKLIVEYHDIFWPAGYPEKIFQARDGWYKASSRFSGQEGVIDGAKNDLADIVHPCKSDMDGELDALKAGLSGVAAACTKIGDACDKYGSDVQNSHNEMVSAIEEFVGETVVIEVGSFLLSFISGGASEIAGQLIEQGRAANVVNKIRGVLEVLGAAVETVIGDLKRALWAVKECLGKLVAIERRSPSFAEKMAQITEDVTKDFAEHKAEGYARYLARKKGENQAALSEEEWEQAALQLRLNAAKGEAYEKHIADELGISPGHDGWVHQGTDDAFPNRRLDFMNEENKMAIEAKSGTLTPGNIAKQLDSDMEGLQKDWTVQWVLHEEPSPEVVSKFEAIRKLYPKFSYKVVK